MNLPTEIWREIFGFLPSSMYYHVSLVSKRLTEVVDPFLYRSIDDESTPGPKLTQLLRNLRKRPELCAHTSTLRLGRNTWNFEHRDELLFTLPHLQELQLGLPPTNLQIRSPSRLRILRLNYHEDYLDYGIEYDCAQATVEPLQTLRKHLWMPSLRTLEIKYMDLRNRDGVYTFTNRASDQETSALFPTWNRKSPVNNLSLTGCSDMDIGVLPEILRSIQKLQRFTFGIFRLWDESEDIPDPGISPLSLSLAVEPHASTLVELIITGDDAARFLQSPRFGSLTHFVNLERLAIPEPFIAPEQFVTPNIWLPSRLEDLQLQYPIGFQEITNSKHRMLCERMYCLAKNNVTFVLPRLRRVIWWYQHANCYPQEHRVTELCDVRMMAVLGRQFEAVGVKFDWLSSHDYGETPFASGAA